MPFAFTVHRLSKSRWIVATREQRVSKHDSEQSALQAAARYAAGQYPFESEKSGEEFLDHALHWGRPTKAETALLRGEHPGYID